MPEPAATSLPLTPGFATGAGTARYRQRMDAVAGHFRPSTLSAELSSIGIGTYLGGHDRATDDAYERAIAAALQAGVNVIDTAINYRFQRSERTIGRVLADLFRRGTVQRDEVVVCTKGGYLAFDDEPPPGGGGAPPLIEDARGWVERTFVEPGIIHWDDIVAYNVMQPAYIRHELDTSRHNLGLETIDVYHLHNPESQLERHDRAAFLNKMRACFEELERAAGEGKIRFYGTATWNGYRVAPDDDGYLSLGELESVARSVGGPEHRFRAVQLPFNLAMPEAFGMRNQRVDGELATPLDAARRLGMTVFASASLLQARLTTLPGEIRSRIPDLETDAQRALQFVRSTPGVTTTLVGMSRVDHVRENLQLARIAPLAPGAYGALYRQR